MSGNILKTLLAFMILAMGSDRSEACTTAVISGKFTKSGRPMIWKVRDTESYNNAMRRYTDGKLPYVGLINAEDTAGEQIWGGFNEGGFAIMNSASFNVNTGYTGKFIDREGYFMREALRTCLSLSDFEALLDKRPRPMGLAAHFGVIDAKGGAAFYEVNNETWTKYDADDPAIAPRGYVLRTNYSFTGRPGEGYGFVRYQTIDRLFAAVPAREMTIQMLMQDFARSTYNSVTQTNLREIFAVKDPGTYPPVVSDDLICRYGTASAIAVEGVADGESPIQTTGWVQIGLPWVSVTLPVWASCPVSPLLAVDEKTQEAPLASLCILLKKHIFPLWKQSDGYHYLDAAKLFNNRATGITQRIEAAENKIFARTEAARLRRHAKNGSGNLPGQQPEAMTAAFDSEITELYTALTKEL